MKPEAGIIVERAEHVIFEHRLMLTAGIRHASRRRTIASSQNRAPKHVAFPQSTERLVPKFPFDASQARAVMRNLRSDPGSLFP